MLMLHIAAGVVLGGAALAALPYVLAGGARLALTTARAWHQWECPRWLIVTALCLVVPLGRGLGYWAFNH